jgi:hypothetical protein
MKTKLLSMTGGLIMLLAFSCQGPETLPFEADFTGTYTAVYPDSVGCGPGSMHVIVDCTGKNELLGSFTTHFDFCSDQEGYYPGARMEAYILAENGDTLHISCAGQVLPGKQEDHPEYVVSYWRDPFEILGGSGKFEGATGSGNTDDYNSNQDQNSHHSWKGSITLQKQKS